MRYSFAINTDNYLHCPIRLERQFDSFINEESKLPFFSISLYDISCLNSKRLKLVRTINKFSYYECDSDGYYFSCLKSYALLSKDYRHVSIYVGSTDDEGIYMEINYLLMFAYRYTLIRNKCLMIHASAVVHNDSTILFCGQSGAGKSTQANLWKKYRGSWVLNYDKPCLLPSEDGYIVHGSPWSGKERAIINDYAPLEAIVFLVQDKKNSLLKLPGAYAFSKMYMNNYLYPIADDIEKENISVIKEIALNAPVYELHCDISENAVEILYQELFG